MAVHELFDEWSTYEKVVAGDYMHHRQYFHEITDRCASLGESLDLLDLGCGDAVPVLPMLEQLPVASYTGVDPSVAALGHARRNLEHLQFPVDFLNCTMEDAADFVEGPFDIILMSFSLHHLPANEKEVMLGKCRAMLASGGVIALVDVFRDAAESRADWLDRWESDARARFKALSAAELDHLVEHVRGNDLPETFAEIEAIAGRAGLQHCSLLARGPELLNGAVLLQRSGG